MKKEPLAFRMRPRHIDEVVGQTHVIGEKTSLYQMIQIGEPPSLLLYGEPGIGKTSIAYAIAGTVSMPFVAINATTSGKKDILQVVERAKEEGTVLLFIDEIHRFRKDQQDVLLPHVENGLIVLIGATTENPFFEVNPAIRSRCGEIKELKRVMPEDIVSALTRALHDRERGVGNFRVELEKDVLNQIAYATNGEVRSALNILEMSVLSAKENEEGVKKITSELISEFSGKRGMNHDKDGDHHYNLLSAFQKSIRGSDVNAALHYLGRLIIGGDEKSIIRRLQVIAHEDIGLANPEAVVYTKTACDSVRELGFPEARIPLANAVVMLCLSPKSNSPYKALDRAMADIQNGYIGEIPHHLRDTHYASASKLGNGEGYKYPHDYFQEHFGGWTEQQYLPDVLKHREYYEPVEAGREKAYADVYKRLSQQKKDV